MRPKALSLDPEELQTLINEYYPQIRRAALALCGDPWEADEIAQETFMAALKSIASLRDASAKGNWLYGICLRIHRSRLRSAMRHMKRITQWAVANGKNESLPATPMRAEVQEWQQGIWLKVRTLPPPQREVIVLRFAEGMSVAEIAVATQCPEGTVKSRLHHALTRLKSCLSAEWITPVDKPALSSVRAHEIEIIERTAATVKCHQEPAQ